MGAETNDTKTDSTASTTADSEPWLSSAYKAFQSDDADTQRSFVQTFIDEHVRAQLHHNPAAVRVQEGLIYDPDVEALVDDFIPSLQAYSLDVPPEAFGFEQINLEGSAITYDTAQIQEAHEDPGTAAPSFDTTLWVRCELGFRARIGQLVNSEVTCRIYAPQAEPE